MRIANSPLQKLHRAVFSCLEILEPRRLLSSTIYVDQSAKGHDNGQDWADAFTNLQSGLAAASHGTTIDVAEGDYSPGADAMDTFQLADGVALEGGYETGGSTTANPAEFVTTLDGDGVNDNVVTGSGANATAVLQGFTVADGVADGDGFQGFGGGMLNVAGSPTVADCAFTNNYAHYSGGAVYNSTSSSPDFSDCTFDGDSASQNGGAIFDEYSTPTLLGCTFSDDVADAGDGGAIQNVHSNALLTNCAISGDTSAGTGGGMFDNYSSPAMTDCLFSGDSSFNGKGGGLGNGYTSNPTLVNCTFEGDSAITSGGAIDNSYSSPVITNCILWNNSAPLDAEICNETSASAPAISFSDVEGGVTGTGNINSNPQFVNQSGGNLAIEPFSPCVDAGKNSAVPSGVTTDLAGNPRFQNVPTSGHTGSGTIPIVDMGAYEAAAALAATTGGPYTIIAGKSSTLHGLGSSNVSGTLSFAWDLNYNGTFVAGVTGQNPLFSTTGLNAGTDLPIALRVTDSGGHSAIATSTIDIVPATMFVDASATGQNNGLSWANAFVNLQSALNIAMTGQTIDVAQGDYSPGAAAADTFQLADGVTIEGGFASGGSAAPVPGDVSTLDGQSNNFTVVTGSATNSSAILENFTIANGVADGTGTLQSFGGGMIDVAGSPTLIDCIFNNNSALVDGGGMYNYDDASPTLINCLFTSNSSGFGGGMYNYISSDPSLINCTFSENTASADGGAIYDVDSSNAALTNCICWNDTDGSGDEIGAILSNPVVNFSDIEGGASGTSDIDSDPLFISATNLSLQAGSPCINAGSNAAVPSTITTDLAGNPRIVGGTVDIGAYEFQLSSVTWTGTADGINWNNAGNWSDDAVPSSATNVVIPTGDTPQIGSGTFSVASLTLQGTGTVDLGKGTLIIDYGTSADPIPSIQTALVSGFAGGAWNGKGIVSSAVASANKTSNLRYAVGYIDGASPPLNAKSPVSSGQIEIMPTLAGDATLAGTVSFYDFQVVLSNFAKSSQNWDQGSFDYTATVDFYDFQAVLSNFGQNASAVTQAAEVGNSYRPVAIEPMPVLTGGADDTVLGTKVDEGIQLSLE